MVEQLSHYPSYSPDCDVSGGSKGGGGSSAPNPRDRYRCVIVRGPGWQKDTLPAPMITTNLWYPGDTRGSYGGCIENPDDG